MAGFENVTCRKSQKLIYLGNKMDLCIVVSQKLHTGYTVEVLLTTANAAGDFTILNCFKSAFQGIIYSVGAFYSEI